MTSLEKAPTSGTEETDVADTEETPSQERNEVIVRGILSVTIISADDLPVADIMGKADPFVVLKMKKGEFENKTGVVYKSLNPVWNETFDFLVEHGLHDMLILKVYDHDTFGKDHMGDCSLTLTRVMSEGEYKDSIPIDGTKSAKLNLHLKWTPQPIYRDN